MTDYSYISPSFLELGPYQTIVDLLILHPSPKSLYYIPSFDNKLIINIYTSILLELGLETQNLCWVLSPLPQGPFPGSRPHRPTWWRVECRPTLSCRGSTREFYTASATVTGPRELRWAWDFRRVYSRTVISQNWTSLPLLTLTNMFYYNSHLTPWCKSSHFVSHDLIFLSKLKTWFQDWIQNYLAETEFCNASSALMPLYNIQDCSSKIEYCGTLRGGRLGSSDQSDTKKCFFQEMMRKTILSMNNTTARMWVCIKLKKQKTGSGVPLNDDNFLWCLGAA